MEDTRAPAPNRDQATGRSGEDLAHGYLHRQGWQVIGRNWRCRHGEIDIVAREPLPDGRSALVFVEVKTRRGRGYGDPLEAITRDKLRKLSALAQLWLGEHDEHADLVRIDGLGIVYERGSSTITHVRGLTR